MEEILGVFAGVPEGEVKPLIVAESVGIVLHEEVVLLPAPFAESAVQVAILELGIEQQVVLALQFLRLLILERFQFFQGRPAWVINTHQRNLVLLLHSELLMNSL